MIHAEHLGLVQPIMGYRINRLRKVVIPMMPDHAPVCRWCFGPRGRDIETCGKVRCGTAWAAVLYMHHDHPQDRERWFPRAT